MNIYNVFNFFWQRWSGNSLKESSNSQKVVMTDLGPEMAGNIFRHLSIKDQFNCQKVCKLWHTYFTNEVCRQQMKIDETWRSHKVCEFLIEKILPQEEKAAMLKVCVRNGKIVITTQASLLALANAWLLFKCIGQGTLELAAWENMSEDEKLSEMNSANATRRNNVITTTVYGPAPPIVSKVVETPDPLPEYKSLKEYDNAITSNINALYIWLPLTLTVAFQVWCICHYLNQRRKNRMQAPGEVNEKIIETLTYPKELKQDPVLKQFICQKSGHVPLIPVKIGDGNFDYTFIKDHITNELQCLVGDQKLLMEKIVFDRKAFLAIQKRLKQLKHIDSPLTKGKCIRVFQLSLFEQKFLSKNN